MKNFKELDKRPINEVEETIINKWGSVNKILEKSIQNRENFPYFVFYDGPATANGMPGIHHMLAKFLKDTFCKYKTMQGYKVLRKVGWDTHGLPVELQVEKELGFTGKKDIEKYGIEAFNQKCRESVWKNEKAFADLTTKMGQFIDLENPYVTYDNNYIETEWWILKKFYEEKLFYEGVKISPYCPRCGTVLASHEVAQGYKDVSVETVIVPMKKKDEDVYFLVWTTTPWTLLANVALCVNPEEEYIQVKSMDYNFILAKKLAAQIFEKDYEIIKTYLGKDLEFTEYEQLIPELEVNKKAFFVTCDQYVTMEDGTGIVHIAPAFGEDDAKIGKNYNLPYLNPVGEDGKYLVGPWQNMSVFEADKEIIQYLKANDKLFKKQKVIHSYPHCWRCDSPLLYYSKPSYYLEITKLKDKIIEANKKIKWYPDYVGEKRFGNWLENLKDWAISRSRYWGTPLPYWTCECGFDIMIGSKKELVSLALEDIDETIDLHRPYVDKIHLKCPKCGKAMKRCSEVIDCWFDSGAMPFAQYHYPFENEKLWETQFPADFICEGIDQTRGWFYVLLVISTFLKGVSPFKNVLVNDLIQDAEGKKMSKSKGNVIEPFSTMKEYGADTVRFYLPYVSPVWVPLKFDLDGLKEVYSKFFNPLRNTYNFFSLYANTDKIETDLCQVEYEQREEIDKWLLSKYNRLLELVITSYEEYDLNKVVKALTDFVSEDLSNWYIRRNRKRFWVSDLDDSKKSVYLTTYEILIGISQIMAPIVPFLSEEIYTNLTGLESVHLSDFPQVNKKLINDNLEKKMDLVRNLIRMGRMVREENKIKVRQPLKEIFLAGKNKVLIDDLVSLIAEELNVKKVTFVDDLDSYMNFEVKPNYKKAGAIFGSKIKEYSNFLMKLTAKEIKNIQVGNSLKIEIEKQSFEITSDLVDIRISAKEGFNVGMEDNNFVILNTELDESLLLEGNAREIVSKIQQLRKTKNFEIVDRITLEYYGDEETEKTFIEFIDYIKNETLATSIQKNDQLTAAFDINGHDVKFRITKI